MSEYTRRYEHVSHEELYQGVNAGDPKQIEGLSAQWTALKGTLDDLSRDLGADLDALAKTWTGDAAREFQRRLTMVSGYSGNLAEGMTGIRQALDMMAGDLRTAQTTAESPEKTDDNDKLLSGAGKGFLLGGAPGALIGGIIGHQQDEAEQEKAHQRMVQVVAKLAEGYDFSAYGRIVVPEPPPTELPGHHDRDDPTLRDGPSVKTPASGPSLGSFGPGANGSATTSGVHHTAPTSGMPGDGAPGGGTPGSHTGAGAPGSVTTGGTVDPTGTSLAGAGPLAGVTGGPTVGGTPGFGPGAGNPTVTTGGGLFGGPGVLSTGSLAGTGPTAASAGRLAGTPGVDSRSATGTGRLTSGRGLTVESESRSTGRTNATGRPAMAGRNGVLGARGGHDDDETDGRLTWLTEDDMVWGDGNAAPPPVLDGN
ncbi:WXG100 family type VII secretion target [Micromonospora sp. WMMD998]|uniref:WXG100 family type VII secretion target n=1 Tax=Micromonospora sp. WMMD998 TaxID=3016092 RepID=UPI00249C6D1B|nr:WXG100 family type VII secretion target [Micromonospora sp. WMMD998]WFE38166.1 WXG100 family type VII secretion target [Micromonospora sp. WMMD998]